MRSRGHKWYWKTRNLNLRVVNNNYAQTNNIATIIANVISMIFESLETEVAQFIAITLLRRIVRYTFCKETCETRKTFSIFILYNFRLYSLTKMFWLYLLHRFKIKHSFYVRNSENEDVLLLLRAENIINVLKAGWKWHFSPLIY